MALLGNYAIFTKNPIAYSGGDAVTGIQGLRYNFNQAGVSRLRFYGDNDVAGVTDRCGLPANYSAPYSWILPPKAGGVGSNVGFRGTGTLTGSGALGMNVSATMSGYGTISNANLGLILSAIVTMSGIGGLSADVSGALQASATMAGSGNLTGALGALAGAVATLSGSGSLSGSVNAIGHVSADIYVNQSEASVQQIVDGVWNALASQYNTSGTMGEAAQTGGGGGGGATAAQIWAYSSRTLTESAGLTTEQAEQLTRIDTRVDTPVSEIAVGWNPYIEGVNGLKKGIQKIVDKVEEKGEEVKKKVETEVKTIVIPEQKEPVVNITTEKIDTKEFIKAIKEIKPEVNITTETVNNEPILTAIKEIGKVSEIKIPEYKEPKEVDLGPIQEAISEVKSKIDEDSAKIDMIEDYIEDKKEEHKKEKEEKERKEKEIEEEENIRRPIPSSFIATLK